MPEPENSARPSSPENNQTTNPTGAAASATSTSEIRNAS